MRTELVVLVVTLVGLVDAASTGGKLGSRCSIKKDSLKTVEDLNSIVEQASAADSACEPVVLEALNAMKAIADDTPACTMKKAQAITDFVEKYLKDSNLAVPKPLAEFAVAYGMQVSGVCSREMVDDFSKEADAILNERLGPKNYETFGRFRQFLIEDSSIGMMLAPLIKTGEIILPGDLKGVAPDVNTKLQVYVSKTEFFNDLEVICKNMLMPLYEPRLLPLAHLIRAGFINRGNIRKKALKNNGRFWSTAVFLCESLKMIEIEERNTPEQAAIEVELGQVVDSYKEHKLDEVEDQGEAESEQVRSLDETPLVASESSGQVDDVIVSSSIRPLVNGYKSNLDEVERLRKRIMRRGMRMMTAMFRARKYDRALSELLGMIKLKEGGDPKAFEEVKETLAGFIESPEADSGAYQARISAPSTGVNKHEMKGVSFGRGVWRTSMALVLAGHLIITSIVCFIVSIFAGGKLPEGFKEGRDDWHSFMMTLTGWGPRT